MKVSLVRLGALLFLLSHVAFIWLKVLGVQLHYEAGMYFLIGFVVFSLVSFLEYAEKRKKDEA